MTRFRELWLQRGLSQEQLCRFYNVKYNRKYTTNLYLELNIAVMFAQ